MLCLIESALLAGQKFGSQVLRNERSGLLAFVRPVTLKAKAAECPKEESHDERNMRLKRPQSPHLTIYSPQLTSMLSISHRITGIALSAYAIGLGLGAIVLPESIPHYIESLECAELGAACISTLKFVLAFPLTYHFWNGIRHLLWDSGLFLSIREVYLTGYIMLALALSSAVALSIM
ncbi:hypothetical protein NQ318_018364 [Aromia moschata]|uniref:Succinate dehydrogenase cytochrome b560 subunit, mitochondrial n=1 Tax=Aromia moschata TaxID=1265417 RepID=A0AAV8ZDS8_9CUCU|nr:hypothetical protein NQ318_018364 [Aromia moschata]